MIACTNVMLIDTSNTFVYFQMVLYFYYKRTDSMVPGWFYQFKKLPLVRKTRHRARDALVRSGSKISEKSNSLVDVIKRTSSWNANNDQQSKDSSDDSFTENEGKVRMKEDESSSKVMSLSGLHQSGALDDGHSEQEHSNVTKFDQIQIKEHLDDDDSEEKPINTKPKKVSFSSDVNNSKPQDGELSARLVMMEQFKDLSSKSFMAPRDADDVSFLFCLHFCSYM